MEGKLAGLQNFEFTEEYIVLIFDINIIEQFSRKVASFVSSVSIITFISLKLNFIKICTNLKVFLIVLPDIYSNHLRNGDPSLMSK